MLIFLKTLTRTVDHLQPVVDLLFHLLCHIRIRHLDTIDDGLMLEQFLDGYLLRNRTVGVPAPFHTFHRSLHTHLFNVRLQDCLITDNPDHLIDDRSHGNRVRISLSSHFGIGGMSRHAS